MEKKELKHHSSVSIHDDILEEVDELVKLKPYIILDSHQVIYPLVF